MDLVKDNVEFMDESNFNILPSETVFEAAKKMRDKSITALIVAGGGKFRDHNRNRFIQKSYSRRIESQRNQSEIYNGETHHQR